MIFDLLVCFKLWKKGGIHGQKSKQFAIFFKYIEEKNNLNVI